MPLTAAIKQEVPIQSLIALQVFMEDLHAWEWLGNVENLAENLILGTAYMDQCIRGTFPTE